MKVKDSITENQLFDLMNNIRPVGIFNTIFSSTDTFYNLAIPLCQQFYTVKCGERTFTSMAEHLLNKYANGGDMLGRMIRSNFIDKWTKIYNSLSLEYNANENLDYTESTESNIVEEFERIYTGNEDVEKSKRESVNVNRTNNRDYQGFNSTTYSPVNKDVDSSQEVIIAEPQNNKLKTTKNDTTNDTKTNDIDNDKTVKGRNESASSLIKKEIDMRSRNIFSNIVLKDIANFITLQVY